MRTPEAIGTNPKILTRARENSGYTIDEIAKKLSKNPNTIISWENGEKIPTFKQLSKLSKFYNYPSAFFFADDVPEKAVVPTDYRTMPDRKLENFPEIKFEIKTAHERREIAIELIRKLGIELNEFPLECSIDDDPVEVATMIRDYLGITIKEQLSWKKDKYSAFNNWRTILEYNDILVFQFSGISPNEIRGYCVNKKPLPVIGVNTGDTPKTRNFSIFHELAHIISNTGGVCDMKYRDRKVERFCDAVAANFLVPIPVLLGDKLVNSHEELEWEDSILNKLSNKFGVSKEVILIALVESKRSTWNIYQRTKARWKERADEDSEPKMIPYHIKVHSWNGKYYTKILIDAYHSKLINRHNLSNYMGDIKWKHIEKMGA